LREPYLVVGVEDGQQEVHEEEEAEGEEAEEEDAVEAVHLVGG